MIVVLSHELSAAELEAMIGLMPDRAWLRGDRIGRSGRAFQPFSGWSVGAEPSEEPAAAHISAVLHRVAEVRNNIAAAAADPRVHSVALWVWSHGPAFGLELPPSRLIEIAGLGATLKIDVYSVDESEQP